MAVCHFFILWCVQIEIKQVQIHIFIQIKPGIKKRLSLWFPGEGFHNYHHTFPFDYSASEFGWRLNISTAFIDVMCFLGLAKDRKRVSKEIILARMRRTGDSAKSG